MNFEGQPEAADITNRIEQARTQRVGADGAVGGEACSAWCEYMPRCAPFFALKEKGPHTLHTSRPQGWPVPCPRQVTLFRVHKHFISPEAHWYRQKYKLGDSAGGACVWRGTAAGVAGQLRFRGHFRGRLDCWVSSSMPAQVTFAAT